MDATLSYGLPRINASGTLLEGIALWGELREVATVEEMRDRALAYCDWAVSMGLLAIRTHVDVTDDRLLGVEAMLEVKRLVAPYLDLQLVAFPQDGLYRCANGRANLIRALDMGVDVVGGIPHFERTMADGAASVRDLCEIAAERGLPVDLHCDETDDPMSRHIETLAAETLRLGLGGRVVGSHLTSMHSMDNYYVSKLLPLIAEAGVAAMPNPLINIVLQGRHDSYPKRRGMTRVKELIAHGMRVGWGQDCVLDPWYSLGTADMLDVAFMGLHVAQMTSPAEMRRCFDMVTESRTPRSSDWRTSGCGSGRRRAWWCSTRAIRSRRCGCGPGGWRWCRGATSWPGANAAARGWRCRGGRSGWTGATELSRRAGSVTACYATQVSDGYCLFRARVSRRSSRSAHRRDRRRRSTRSAPPAGGQFGAAHAGSPHRAPRLRTSQRSRPRAAGRRARPRATP